MRQVLIKSTFFPFYLRVYTGFFIGNLQSFLFDMLVTLKRRVWQRADTIVAAGGRAASLLRTRLNTGTGLRAALRRILRRPPNGHSPDTYRVRIYD